MAGEIVMSHARNKNVSILPVDSEHNAIFQCLEAKRNEEIQNLILTASGGPFRQLPAEQLKNVTKSDALRHPTWKMGQKITIDSATLFNKGLEMIEARWLFNVPMSRVQVIDSSAEHRALNGRICGWLDPCPVEPFRYVFPNPVRRDLAGSSTHQLKAAASRRSEKTRIRRAQIRRFSRLESRPRGRRSRRCTPGNFECRERSGSPSISR